MSRGRIADGTGHGGGRRLSICPACRRDFVVPVAWDEYDETSWWMRLRCGSCGHRFDVLADDTEVEAFCIEVDGVLDEFERAAARLARERLEAEIEVFSAALELDLISGDDFAPRDGS